MPARVRSLLAPLLVSLCGLIQLEACTGADDPSPVGPPAAGGNAGGGGSPVVPAMTATTPIPDPNEPAAGAPGRAFRDPLCGTDTCMPDDAASCAGEDVELHPEEPEGEGGGPSTAEEAASSPLSACRVVPGPAVPVDEGEGEGGRGNGPFAVCMDAGSGELDAPCFSTGDCGAGLACIGGGLSGRCRPFCCGGDGACRLPGTYCSRQPQREAATSSGEPLIVPVCVPADDCDLAEPFPCPSGRSCDCSDGKACMVVRTEPSGNQTGTGAGTTACVEPGSGKAGEACPCAAGHVCSATSGTCLELCLTVAAKSPCEGRCQASSELPPGFGVCIR